MATEVRTGSVYGIGVYGTDTFGVSNTAITVDGVAGTTALNAVVVTADAPVSVTGVSATASLGSIEVDINIIGRPDADIPMAGSVGTVSTVAEAVTIPASVSATNNVGTLPTPDSVYDVIGVEATGEVNGGYTDKYDGLYVVTNTTNAIYGEGVYGSSAYGYVDPNVFHEVDSVSATASVGNVSTSADNNTLISAGVFAEIITDAVAVVGDEVTIVAGADVDTNGVEGTASVGTVQTQTTNVFEVVSVSATGSLGNAIVVAEANTDVTGVETGSSIGDVTVTARSVVDVTGVSATGTIDANVVVRNNARPTFDSVPATSSLGSVSVTAVRNVFQSANRIEARTVYVKAETPTVVYIPADKNRTVYVKAA